MIKTDKEVILANDSNSYYSLSTYYVLGPLHILLIPEEIEKSILKTHH